jgi:hypothetical protein
MQLQMFYPFRNVAHITRIAALGRALAMVVCILTLGVILTDPALAANNRKDFAQCSNNNPALGQCVWIGSNVQDNNSVYIEGMALAQRLMFDNVVTTTCQYSRHRARFRRKAGSTVHMDSSKRNWRVLSNRQSASVPA